MLTDALPQTKTLNISTKYSSTKQGSKHANTSVNDFAMNTIDLLSTKVSQAKELVH
jgi:hypothetical protein